MASGQQYDEVYRQDGRIKGNGKPTCYGVRHDGDDSIEWLDGDDVVGEGELSNVE